MLAILNYLRLRLEEISFLNFLEIMFNRNYSIILLVKLKYFFIIDLSYLSFIINRGILEIYLR